MTETLAPFDWIVIALFILSMLGVGLLFARRAGENVESFFVSSRSLPWYVSGASMIATGFASDTPLWVTSLIRQYGVYYTWQYWAPFLGGALAIVLFARLWRRMGVITDVEFIESRYSGRCARILRFWSGASIALFFCPLTIGWVTKAMEVLGREAMGLPEQYRGWSTAMVVCVALVMCTVGGLWGVVYTDFIQFIIATLGTLTLAVMSVRAVGGLDAMVEQLSDPKVYGAPRLSIMPQIGPTEWQMPVWNAIGYFGMLWLIVAISGGYQAQRLLACKDSRHSTYAMLMHSLVYYALLAWPWILVALCSVILLPDLGGLSHDHAYPRMLVRILPVGMRGLLVAALLAAFISTVSTLFNWGSSYLVNDVYKRFLVRSARPGHYIWVARLATLVMAVAGGYIGFVADNLQQLITISYVIGTSWLVIALMRWFWWRLNAAGDLAANVAAWVVAYLLLFGKFFNRPMAALLDLPDGVTFHDDPTLVGARMLVTVTCVTVVGVVVTCLTRPSDLDHLKRFVLRARPFHFFWKPVIRELSEPYYEYESFARTCLSWVIGVACIGSLLIAVGKLLLGEPWMGLGLLLIFVVTLYLTVRRINADFAREKEAR